MTTRTIASGTVADAYLELLGDRGVDYLFGNAGTDFAPLIESYAKAAVTGVKVPQPITCPHENVAMAMAMGYFCMTGKAQAVMVHVNVGTANGLCMLINAMRGNVPVLFSAGRTPYGEDSPMTGSRTGEIHWPQEMFDQRAMVREMVRWDYELPNAHVLETTVDRALNMAMGHPQGPVYLTLPREVLADGIENFTYDSPSRHASASAPRPDADAIAEAAHMIARAENPLIITSDSGRDPREVSALGQLAERFAIPVSQRKPRYMCLGTDHPMNAGYNPDGLLDAADVIVVAGCDVPWIPNKKKPSDDCRIIHIGPDPLYARYPMRGFRADLAITGALAACYTELDAALAAEEKGAKSRIDARRKTVAELREKQADRARAVLEKARTESPIHPAWISYCVNEVKGADDIVVKESQIQPNQMSFTQPGTMFSLGFGGGLGWGLGTALGMKLAAREKQVICTVGDGAYMFGNPVSAHYVSRAEDLPLLWIVFNNQMWNAVRRNTREVYPEGYAAKSNAEPLTYFHPGSAFEKVVEVADGYGEKVEDPEDLPFAIDRAMNAIAKDGRQALLNVVSRNA